MLLERPPRPALSSAENLRAAVAEGDILALTKLCARDMATLMAYARQLEALLDAIERQREKPK